MKKLLKRFWPILIILAVSLFLLRSFIKPGFPETHDGQLYLARMANFHLAVIDRHFPVRWAPNLNYKFGYPVFHFNYYTPFALGMFPVLFGADFETAFKVVILLSLFSGGLFFYLLMKKKLNRQAGLIAGLVYVAAPYQMLDILVRCSIGEIVSLGVLPFLLWSLDNLLHKANRLNFTLATLGLAFFSLTHNIIFFFSLPLLLLFCLLTAPKRKNLLPVIASAALAAGLTLFFWLPALLEKQYTNIDQLAQMSSEYADHFLNLKQLVYSPWGYGYSRLGPNDGMSLQLGPFHWLLALVSLFFFTRQRLWLFFALVFAGSIFFVLGISAPVWKILPLVSYVQFPWRLLTFATLASAGLAGFLWRKLPKLTWLLTILALVYIALIAKPAGWFDWDKYFYYEYPFNTSIMSANTPKWFAEDKNIYFTAGHFFDLRGVASLQEISWKTQQHIYEINTPEETEILDRTTYFPGWEVRIDGQLTAIDYQKSEYPGIITFKVPPGQHRIEVRFTENTPARRLGDIISIVSLVALLIILEKWPWH